MLWGTASYQQMLPDVIRLNKYSELALTQEIPPFFSEQKGNEKKIENSK